MKKLIANLTKTVLLGTLASTGIGAETALASHQYWSSASDPVILRQTGAP